MYEETSMNHGKIADAAGISRKKRFIAWRKRCVQIH